MRTQQPVEVADRLGAARVVLVGAGPAPELVHARRPEMDVLHFVSPDLPRDTASMLDFRPESIARLFESGASYAREQLGTLEAFARADVEHRQAIQRSGEALSSISGTLTEAHSGLAAIRGALALRPPRTTPSG